MKLIRFIKKQYIILIFLCVFVSVANASTETSANELIQLLNNVHTMQATFSQRMVNSKGKQVGQKTTGSMVLERPGKFRWEIVQPNKQLIIINGNQLLIYDIDLAQATKRIVDYKNTQNPAMLLSGDTKMFKEMFEITKLKEKGSSFQLKPKQSIDYQWIKMNFTNGQLNAMTVLDKLGQQNEILFNNVVLNSRILQSSFNVLLSKNIDVIVE